MYDPARTLPARDSCLWHLERSALCPVRYVIYASHVIYGDDECFVHRFKALQVPVVVTSAAVILVVLMRSLYAISREPWIVRKNYAGWWVHAMPFLLNICYE
jgi:hypothetical protein